MYLIYQKFEYKENKNEFLMKENILFRPISVFATSVRDWLYASITYQK